MRSYDYFKLAEDKTYGFERTATLIRAARKEFANTLLVDNGDTIQGTALADYEAEVKPIPCTQQLSMYKAMGALSFDAGTLGNHEFNYGLPFLNQVLGGGLDVDGVDASQKCAGNGYPAVLANVYSSKTKKPLVQPYAVLERTMVAKGSDGKEVKLPIKIGVIGFTTPGIMNWDKRYLEGKVYTEGAVEATGKYVPELRAKGADVVVALLHGGMDGAAYSATMENPVLYLSKVAGIDAMVMGHQHSVFPDLSAKPAYPERCGQPDWHHQRRACGHGQLLGQGAGRDPATAAMGWQEVECGQDRQQERAAQHPEKGCRRCHGVCGCRPGSRAADRGTASGSHQLREDAHWQH